MGTRSVFPRGYFVVAILAIVALITAFLHGTTGVAHDDDGDANATIYRSAGPDSHNLIQLDPRTLDDIDNAELTFLPVTPWSLLFSHDGKVVAGVDNDGNLVIRHELMGLAVTHVPIAGYGWPVALNADGSKVLVRLDASSMGWWNVFDTATGELVVNIREDTGWSNPGVVQVDPVAWKLYYLFEHGATVAKQEAPIARELLAVDLATGAEVGRKVLSDVEIGAWDGDLDPDPNGTPIHNNYTPGLALSPDGRELAIVHATNDGVTLVDTSTLAVSRTMTMHEEASMLGKVFAFIAPQKAEAKFSEGTMRTAFYSADSKHLYVSGQTSTVDGEVQINEGHGLRIVSLDDGEIERRTLDGISVDRIVALPDSGLYVTGNDFRNENPNFSAQIIARLDADATDVQAERTLSPEYVAFVIVPAV